MNIGKRKETPVLTLLRGPDGTVTAVDDDIEGEGIERLEPAQAADVLATELEPFLTGCLSVLPDPLEDGWPRLGFLLFSLGAADRYWSRAGLDHSRFQSYAEGLLQRFGLSAQQAATLVTALPQLYEDEFATRALAEGGGVFDAWRESRDPNVVLRLTELVAEWRRA